MTVIQKSFYKPTLEEAISEWQDPYLPNDMSDAEDLIHMLIVEIAGKDEVIKSLTKDIQYYRKDWKDQMIQDRGVDLSLIHI